MPSGLHVTLKFLGLFTRHYSQKLILKLILMPLLRKLSYSILKKKPIFKKKNLFYMDQCYSYYRTPDKSVKLKIIFLISQPKHMLWVLKRTISMRRFF